jgi:hypothetical protein
MKIESNQKAKDDARIARVILVSERDEDYELLEDMLEYLRYREVELEEGNQNGSGRAT